MTHRPVMGSFLNSGNYASQGTLFTRMNRLQVMQYDAHMRPNKDCISYTDRIERYFIIVCTWCSILRLTRQMRLCAAEQSVAYLPEPRWPKYQIGRWLRPSDILEGIVGPFAKDFVVSLG